MSWGICICSICKREVHQKRSIPGDFNSKLVWYHCDDTAAICEGATAAYPKSNDEIVGKWCGSDRGPNE